MNWTKGQYSIIEGREAVDIPSVHALLLKTYWASTRPLEVVRTAVENSICFNLFDGRAQIGFGRVLTDYATYAILLDIAIAEAYRGAALGTWLVECMTTHPAIRDLRQMLWTMDAWGFYKRFGFEPLVKSVCVMAKPADLKFAAGQPPGDPPGIQAES